MWEQIRANKRKAVWLITLMGLIMLLMGYTVGEAMQQGAGPLGVFVGLVVVLVQLGVYALAGETVLMSGMGAQPLSREDSPRLFNIVEEMQLASGLAYMPRLYLIDSDAPNAFAVGRKPETSIIAVTRGLMYRLNRDELQGVIAHEMAHLKNLDTRFMTLAGVMLGSIIIMSDLGARMFFYGGRGRKRSSSRGDSGNGGGAQVQALIFIIAIILVVLGPILARILYFAVSRTREYLADASAAVFTRYPEGLASALLKISYETSRSSAQVGDINRAVAPMFIINPLGARGGGGESVFATHPPLDARVRILRAMGGASFMDYNQAFQSVRKGSHVIGKHTLSNSKGQLIRAASEEVPLATRAHTKVMVHRMAGYAAIACQCGATLKIPSTYREETVRCIRCGAIHQTPEFSVADQVDPAGELGGLVSLGAMAAAGPPPLPIDYTRKSPGAWEGFPCGCGKMIQLSPLFEAPTVQCRNCGAIYRIQ